MQRNLFRLFAAMAGMAVPLAASAAYTINTDLIDPCVAGEFACNPNLAGLFSDTILAAAGNAFKGVLFASLLFYGIKLLFTANSDNAATETKQAYLYAVAAAILVAGAEMLSAAFGTPGTIAPQAATGIVEIYILPFIEGLVVAALLGNITFQGFRMILASDDAAMTKARKQFLYGAIGVVIVVLAVPIVNTLWGKDIGIASTELAGIGNFLITLFGILAVVGIIVSGIMLIISIDESLKDRARKLLIGCIVALIVVISAGALVNLFILPEA